MPSEFRCLDDQGCDGTTPGGRCEAAGYCSFPDDGCSSGRRYGNWAAEGFAGACVDDADSGSMGSSPTTSTTAQPGPTSDTARDGSSTGADVVSSESTSADPQCPEGWWDCTWTRRQSISVQAVPLAEPLTALPVPLRLDPSMLRDPSLTIVDASGSPRPMEHDGGLLWVATDLEPNTPLTLWAYGGNPAPPPGRPTAVWDPSYAAVWHLEDGTDASGRGNTAVSEEVVHQDAHFEHGAMMDGVDDRFDLDATASLADLRTSGFTIEAWIEPDADSLDGYRRILDKTDDPDSTLGWSLMLRGDAPLHQLEINYGYDTDERQLLSEPFEVTDWTHLVVVTHPGDDAEFWVDGELLTAEVTTPGVGSILSDALQPASMGAPTTGASEVRFFDGGLDEVRISRGVRPPSWVTGTYITGRPEAVTVGAIEDLEFE